MKSPLKDRPLRNPGESIDREIYDVLLDGLLRYYMVAVLLGVMAGLEWWRWYTHARPSPLIFTACALIAIVVAVWRGGIALRRVKRLKQGRDGEKAVGQYLDKLRASGAEVFHDVPGNKFNLDHVVIHASGLYVIETKTWSKPDRGEAKLQFDGESVTRGGLVPERNVVIQVRAARDWLVETLKESTGRKFPARSVVVFPGWFIEPTAEAKGSDVWVLNPKALPAFIGNSRQQLSAEDVKLGAYHLGRYIRGAAGK